MAVDYGISRLPHEQVKERFSALLTNKAGTTNDGLRVKKPGKWFHAVTITRSEVVPQNFQEMLSPVQVALLQGHLVVPGQLLGLGGLAVGALVVQGDQGLHVHLGGHGQGGCGHSGGLDGHRGHGASHVSRWQTAAAGGDAR